MTLPSDIKVTTEILWQGALIFALVDVAFISVLVRRIKAASLRRRKWAIVGTTGVFWCIIWILMTTFLWAPVYSYVFPEWARWVIPPVYGVVFAMVGWLFWWLAFRLPGNPVINLCLLGGLWGMITHIWAIYRGILDKPPMLQGASPIATAVMPIFEFIFYWCIILSVASLRRGRREG
jgi:hypothetical protein